MHWRAGAQRPVSCVGAAAALLLCTATVSAQDSTKPKPPAQLSFGMTLPVAFDQVPRSGQERTDSGTKTTVGAWGEVVAFASPVIGFHTGVQFPRAYVTHDHHAGSGSFTDTLSHRDVTVYELIGFHSRSRTMVQPAGEIGLGIVFSRTNHRSVDRVETRTFLHSQICPSILGGVEVPLRLSSKVALVMQARAQATFRRTMQLGIDDQIYGRFALMPAVGLRIHAHD